MVEEAFTGPGQVAILAATLAGLITTLAGFIYNYKREGRRQAWEVERREWEAGAAERHREVSEQAKEERAGIAKRVEEAEIALNAKIDENTVESRKAFTEANHMNAKLKAQNDAFDKMLDALFNADVEREARLAAAAVLAASKIAEVTATTAAGVAAKVAENSEVLEEVTEITADTQTKVTQIRDKVVGNGD